MEVVKKDIAEKEEKEVKNKVYWRCAVPGCDSKKAVPKHAFPKHSWRSEAWRKAVANPDLDGLTIDQLCNYRVCHRHFSEDAYNVTQVRRVLGKTAVPELFLNLIDSKPPVFDNPTIDNTVEVKEEIASANLTTGPIPSTNMETEVLPEVMEHVSRSANLAVSPTPGTSKEIKDSQGSDTNAGPTHCSTPKTLEEQRLQGKITRKNKLTPVASNLRGITKNLLRQAKSVKKLRKCRERLRNAQSFSRTVEMEEIESLSKEQRAFMEMHIRNVHKKAKAQRFTFNDKVLALAIMKQSGQCYRLLSGIFILPTPKCLRRFLQKISLKPGVNKLILDHLKEQGKNMSEEDKICYLNWDELSTDAQLYYDAVQDKIVGFEDWGNCRTSKIADHALVFALRGIKKNWVIPLSYNFCMGSTSADQLVRCIKEIVRAVKKAGFKIVASVCDQGATNVSCIKKLLKKERDACQKENRKFGGTFQLSGQKIIPLYDPPHLIKGIRNNLLTKELELLLKELIADGENPSKRIQEFLLSPNLIQEITEKSGEGRNENERYTANWDTLELGYDMANKTLSSFNKQLPKLTENHIRKQKIRKMRVNDAARVLSRTMSAFIRWLTCLSGPVKTIDGEKCMPIKEGVVTAEIIKFFNYAFDSVNGSKTMCSKEKNLLRKEVTAKSCHMEYWKNASNSMLKHLQFLDPKTRKPKSVPSLKNWAFTLKGFRKLWTLLVNNGFKDFSPRFVSQDWIENFFGMIRSQGNRNINPTCTQFEGSYKSLLINNLTSAKTVKGNCKDDGADVLFSLRKFATLAQEAEDKENVKKETGTTNEEQEYVLFPDTEETRSGTKIEIRAVFAKFVRKLQCRDCCMCMKNLAVIFKGNAFSTLLKEAHFCLEGNIPLFCFKKDIVKNLKLPLRVLLDLSFIDCEAHSEHVADLLVTTMTIEYVLGWCRLMNHFLKGKNPGLTAQSYLSRQAIKQYRMQLQKKNR